MAQCLSQQLGKNQLMGVLQQLLADEKALAEVAKRSYIHGNGFVKVVLLNESGFKLRLHIWFAGCACEENIHDHRWSFASHVLLGQLKIEIWQDAQEGVSLPEYRYVAANAEQASCKQSVGMTRVRLQQQCVYGAGESYVMSKQVLHRIINPGSETVASIMCSAPTAQDHTRLIPSHVAIGPQVQMPALSSADLVAVLQRFLAECEAVQWAQCA